MQHTNAAFPLKQMVSGILLCFCSFPLPAQQNPPEATVYTEGLLPVYPQVAVNGRVSDGLYRFVAYQNRLLVEPDTLKALGIAVPEEAMGQAEEAAGRLVGGAVLPEAEEVHPNMPSAVETATDGAGDTNAAEPETANMADSVPDVPKKQPWLDMQALHGLDVQYDAARQTLALTAPLAWLNLPTTRIGARPEVHYDIARSGYAAVLNYDANTYRNGNGDTGGGLLAEARISTPAGYLNHQHLWSRHHADGAVSGRGYGKEVRLDTFWRTVWPEQGLALTAGDVTAGGGVAGGSRIGGVKFEHTYSVQPWRNTAPLRAYVGEATLPSAVDLYVDGVRQYSRDVAAGKYEITLPPTVSGRGMAQVVATDVLGRTVSVDMPLYGGSGLLAKGLSEWSLEAGYLRRDYGVESFRYDKNLLGSGSLRYGLSQFLTARVHATGGGGYRQFGGSFSAVLGTLGQLDVAHAQSFFRRHKGRQSSAFFSTQVGSWSLGTGWSSTDNHFSGADVIINPKAYAERPVKNNTVSVSAGWYGERVGSLNASYLRYRGGGTENGAVGTLSWNRSMGKYANIFLSAARYTGHIRQNSIYGGLSLSFDKGYSASLGSRRENGRNSHRLAFTRSAQGAERSSWGIAWEQENGREGSGTSRLSGNVSRDTQYGEFQANVYRSRSQTDWNAAWRGGLVWMGGLFPTRHVYDSFAVVSTNGVEGVPVLLANSKIGSTNRKGLLLVPNLSAYRKNMLDIDMTDLPEDMGAEYARIQAVPSERSGVAVRFKLTRMQAAAMVLKDGAGNRILANSTVLRNGEPVAVVGFDGQTFVGQLVSGRNTFEVSLPENRGSCRFGFDYRPEQYGGSLPDLGEISCTE